MSKAQCMGVNQTDFTGDDGKRVKGCKLHYVIEMLGVTGHACMTKFFREGNADFEVWENLLKQAAGNEKNLPGKTLDMVFGPKGNIESIKLITV